MDENNTAEARLAKAAALKNCLIYLLSEAKEVDLDLCALHLRIAISELNNLLEAAASDDIRVPDAE